MNQKITFSGFADWVEIFTGGRQTDSAGNTHDGDALIDRAVASFDAKYHEPPAVIGHPAQDAPAYGWVETVKSEVKDGAKRLYAKFRQVVPEFEEMVKSGQFKKRSASFYPDGRLRHVGWLGAMPPAVKGLADVAFAADDQAQAIFEFTDNTPITPNKEQKMTFTEFMEAMKFWKKIQDNPDAEIPAFATAPRADVKQPAAFSEADIEAAKKEAAKTAKAEAEAAIRAEFAESAKTEAIKAAKAKIAKLISTGVEKGTIVPAWKDTGLAEFMESLDPVAAIDFGENSSVRTKDPVRAKDLSPLQWFIDFLESLPKLVDFSEIATRATDVGAGNAGEKLAVLVKKKQALDKTLTYSAAFSEVMVEHPELATEYAQQLGQ